MPSCGGCGKQLLEDMRFCPYCGRPVVSEEVEHFVPAKGEVVTAVAAPARVEGKEGQFALAFTDERIIFARITTTPRDKVKSELLEAGIFLPGSGAGSNVSRYYEMSPGDVLGESAGNFHVSNDEVSSVKLSYDEGRYKVVMKRDGETLCFDLPYERYYRDLLFRAFEGRMTW